MTLSPDTDSRAEIQALLDATPTGGTLDLPAGEFFVTRAGSAYYALRVPAGVRVRGHGTTIRQAPGTAASVRIFQMDGAGATLEALDLDGDAANQTVDEHRAGAFVAAADCTLRGVTAHDFTGDGLYVYTGADRALIEGCAATGNRRNGITIAGGTGVRVYGGTFAGNVAQQVDSEPGTGLTVNNVTIADAVIDCGSSAQFALTVSGSSATSRSTGWRVTGCTITGGINVVWADDVLIGSNVITLPGALPVRIYRTSSRVTVARNTITQANAAQGSYPSAIYAVGTGTGQAPDDVLIAGNTITCAAPSALGVRAQGVVDVTIVDNVIIGAGIAASMAAGVYVRATDTATPVRAVTIVGNAITDHGARGVSIAGYSVNGKNAQISSLRIAGNAIGSVGGPQITGIVADDGTHPVVSAVIVDNGYGAGVSAGRL